MTEPTTNELQLKAGYRKMTVPQLVDYRQALTGDLEDAKRRKARGTVAFCEERRKWVGEVLEELGVIPLN